MTFSAGMLLKHAGSSKICSRTERAALVRTVDPESAATVTTANWHEFTLLKAYGKEVYTPLDSGAIPNVMSRSLAESHRSRRRVEFKASPATRKAILGFF